MTMMIMSITKGCIISIMDLNKSLEFFNPKLVTAPIHVIGCGAIGASIAELLTRAGIKKLTLWDFDTVASHNIANQLYTFSDIYEEKTVALEKHLKEINPEIVIVKEKECVATSKLSGYIFLCVDNIEVRQTITKRNMYNPSIKAFFDVRMALVDGSFYAANWSDETHKTAFLASMNYSHEEAKANVPVSACGFELSVAPTVRILAAYQVANFMNFLKGESLVTFGMANAFAFITEVI